MDFASVLKSTDIPADQVRLVRHGYKEIDPLRVFRTSPEKFHAYQSFQSKNKFGKSQYIAAFAPHAGNHALFLGIWEIESKVPASSAPPEMLSTIGPYISQFSWNLADQDYYQLNPTAHCHELSERLVIDWGGSAVSWVQKRTDKPVIAILPHAQFFKFDSFETSILDFEILCAIVKNDSANMEWQQILSSVNGVYCISDASSGKLYVGSAYGREGIWGRWTAYAQTGHGGNSMLKKLVETDTNHSRHFTFSILEILPPNCTNQDAIRKESQ